MTGKIKKLLVEKQFGFIQAEGKDYFFHRDDLTESHWVDLLNDYNQEREITVEFDPSMNNKKGPRAENVRIV